MRLTRFVLIGVVNTAFGYGVFAATWLMSQSNVIALTVAYVAGPLFNYFTVGKFVFTNRGLNTLPLFLLGYLLTAAINLALLEVLVRFGIGTLLAQILCTPPIVFLSFLYNNFVVFRSTKRTRSHRQQP
ncbi:MAG: GtrA family protein [Alphaproteobacteria bacterium]|nr:MAG: GtrA family protein [Alphaproteobacteria bacterium]